MLVEYFQDIGGLGKLGVVVPHGVEEGPKSLPVAEMIANHHAHQKKTGGEADARRGVGEIESPLLSLGHGGFVAVTAPLIHRGLGCVPAPGQYRDGQSDTNCAPI